MELESLLNDANKAYALIYNRIYTLAQMQYTVHNTAAAAAHCRLTKANHKIKSMVGDHSLSVSETWRTNASNHQFKLK